MASSPPFSTLFLIFFIFCIFLQLPFPSLSQATVPPSNTFRYVNQGGFGEYKDITEYNPDYRPLPPFTNPFQLCFYNTTPNSYTLGLRMGTRRTQSLMRWVWEANRGNPVRENATFTFGQDGNLVLADADGRIAWQTNTANKGVVAFEIEADGNIVLRNSKGNFVWQSFDSPTDTLLIGQSLRAGGVSKLVSRASVTENVDGPHSLVLEPKRLALYYKSKSSSKPLLYWSSLFEFEVKKIDGVLVNMTFRIVGTDTEGVDLNMIRFRLSNSDNEPGIQLGRTKYNSTLTYLRLGIDGNVKVYTYRLDAIREAWEERFSFFNRQNFLDGECQLPERCGKFGLCEDSQCVGCPTPKGILGWSRECEAKKVTSCRANEFGYYKLVGVDHATVKYERGDGPVKQTDCERKCTRDCECAGYFYHTDGSRCWIVYELKTLTRVGNSTHLAYIKTPRR